MTRLRVATLNIHWGVNRAGDYALQDTADLVESLGADVVALQEVDRCYDPRSDHDDQPALLADRLGLHASYGASVVRPAGEYGIAVLTREPPDQVMRALLPNRPGLEQRSALAVRSAGVTVVCTHLEHSEPGIRLEQAEAVADLAVHLPAPVVVAGDLNDVPGSGTHAALTERLTDALAGFADLAERPTFEDPALGRIDHVLLGPGLLATAAEVVDTTATDHSAVVVDVEVLPAP